MSYVEFVSGRQVYEHVIQSAIPGAARFVWIGTADIKDLHVERPGGVVPFLEVLSELLENGVEVRLIFAREPGQAFRTDFDRYPNLAHDLEQLLCPRVHFKCVVVDGEFAYLGSANLTGAGMGAKSDNRRNFEMGVVSRDPAFVKQVMNMFDEVWMGKYCACCERKEYCGDYREML